MRLDEDPADMVVVIGGGGPKSRKRALRGRRGAGPWRAQCEGWCRGQRGR